MKAFFDSVRAAFGSLSQSQVDGFTILLAAANGLSIPHIAYILATAWHETARTMQPIAEYGKGKGKKYGKIDGTGKAPYGRGYVQLTWRDNYIKADQKLGLGGRLAADYDLAMNADVAAKIIVRGMVEGWFTGKKLADYTDYSAMRRIVNGTDKAAAIAKYAVTFETALKAAAKATQSVSPILPVEPPKPPEPLPDPIPEPPQAIGFLTAILNLIALIFGRKK